MKSLRALVLLLWMIAINAIYAQPVNLFLENMTVSTTEYFQATGMITAGPNFTVASTGNVTLDAPNVSLKNSIFVIEGGTLMLISQTTTVETKPEESGIPDEFGLSQNYPNPFNPVTVVGYQLPVAGFVSIKVYDILGGEVAALVDEYKPAGRYEVKVDAEDWVSGVYIYELRSGNYVMSRKMTLLK